MTGYKHILVPVGDARSGEAPLRAAMALAERFEGHVAALHVRSDPTQAVPLVGEGMSGAMVEEMMNLAERQAAERADEARRSFEAVCAAKGVPPATIPGVAKASAEWVDVTGREEEYVAWRARLVDLVVMGRPQPDLEIPSSMVLNAALMEGGKPVLVVPQGYSGDVGGKAAIAWNGSAEAGRAVAAALPLLARAGTVQVLSIAEDDRSWGATAGDLAAHLAWHGIDAECRTLAGPAGDTGESLLSECERLGIDLLVMGAYTHSRLRQLILGGVTRHVLHHAELPCLMCH